MAEVKRRAPQRPLDHKPAAVRRARQRVGLTQDALAKAVGVSPSLMSEIEKGTRNATQATILRLAEVLECDPDSLRRRRLGPVQDMAQNAAA
jgi:transcriptional regulator with XRE-family HTH domain